MPDPAWTTVATCDTGLEADMMKATLEALGIPYRVLSTRAGIFGAGFGGSVPGGFTLAVPREHVERAREQLGVGHE